MREYRAQYYKIDEYYQARIWVKTDKVAFDTREPIWVSLVRAYFTDIELSAIEGLCTTLGCTLQLVSSPEVISGLGFPSPPIRRESKT